MIVQWIKYQILFFIFILILIGSRIGFSQNIQFGQITVEDGLSNSYVNCLLEDQSGFIWFGTDDGLNRYDGYEIKVYRNNPDDSTSLSDNIIWELFEDRAGYIWIGTKGGKLSRYDPFLDKFKHWDLDSSGTGESAITNIIVDNNNFIWIGTYRDGLYRFDQEKNKFDHWRNYGDNEKVLTDNFITSLIEDNHGTVWISTYGGLDKYNIENPEKPFIRFQKFSENPEQIRNYPVWYLANSSFFNNSIWIGNLNGLTKFDPSTEKFSTINLPESSNLQFGFGVSSVVEEDFDGEKILWIGTYGGLVRNNLTTGENNRFVQSKEKWLNFDE